MGISAKAALINLAVYSALILPVGVAAQEAESTVPPLIPQNELVIPDVESLVERCMARVPKTLGIEIGGTLTTRSVKWGLVWRADFTLANTAGIKGISRIVCRDAQDDSPLNVAFVTGQPVRPLPPR